MKNTKLTNWDGFGHWLLISWNDAPSDWWIGGIKQRPRDLCANMFNPTLGITEIINFDQIEQVGKIATAE